MNGGVVLISTKKYARENYNLNLLKKIGKGKYANVYLVGKNKVIKVIKHKYQKKHNFTKLKKEIAFFIQLNGIEFIPTMYEYGEDYILMEYINGDTLMDLFFRGVKITENQMNEITTLLERLELLGIYHNDTHFENVILKNNKLYLIDLGNADIVENNYKWKFIKKLYPYYNRNLYKITHIPGFHYLRFFFEGFKHFLNFMMKLFLLIKRNKFYKLKTKEEKL